MKLGTKTIIILLILIVSICTDQITKKIAFENLAGSPAISFLNNFFVLEYAENTGGFLGMGAGISNDIRFWVFSVLVALFLGAMLVYLFFSKGFSMPQVFALSAILGGGIGNLIDRFQNDGRVVDFMNMGIGPIRTGIFNVADMFITFGAIFLFLLLMADGMKKKGRIPEPGE